MPLWNEATLKTRVGMLGVIRDPEPGAEGIAKGTAEILQTAATKWAFFKRRRRKLLNRFDQRMKSIVHMVAVDAAADEVLASEIMRMPALASLGNITPDLRFMQRDKAHGGRRIMTQPWRRMRICMTCCNG